MYWSDQIFYPIPSCLHFRVLSQGVKFEFRKSAFRLQNIFVRRTELLSSLEGQLNPVVFPTVYHQHIDELSKGVGFLEIEKSRTPGDLPPFQTFTETL